MGIAYSFDERPDVVVDGDYEVVSMIETVVHVLDHGQPQLPRLSFAYLGQLLDLGLGHRIGNRY
jgi:hypothetical protein